MLAMREKAAGADLMLCPELQLIGYPPEDLVLKPALVRAAAEEAARLVAATATPGPAMLIGTVVEIDGKLYNAMLLADGGREVARVLKHELPNYGTFDEKRVFAHGPLPEPVEFRGVKLGIPICEDIWQDTVCDHLAELGAEMLLVPNGSPYELNKDALRQALVRSRVADTGLPLAYLNRVGGPGRTGVRRLILHHAAGRRRRRRTLHPIARLGRSIGDDRVGPHARRLALHDLPHPRARSLSGRRLPRDDGRLARLCRPQRLPRRPPRPVWRDRQRVVRCGRGRCAWAPIASAA